MEEQVFYSLKSSYNRLQDESLLEQCYDEKRVKMHDVVRDFALREGRDFSVKAGINAKHQPEEKEWLQIQKIS
ncbi:putative disease resistance protein [Cinnamomum micranthum f. kanehirae]|uniref:Putative disease resistance protein n=1 Tax=Cinnamomum micranthum f. kanehirae TaxID=337451 RepID=A0A443N0J9_9MAGN|nr:putative disease resistance protein [Cinnamomum micranthum f. kanehirae]